MNIVYRPGTPADSYAVFLVFDAAVQDLTQRMSYSAASIGIESEDNAISWERIRPLFEHLANTAEFFWVAELDGNLVGYARTINRGGIRELTEFFVTPAVQTGGIGRELLRRAFPEQGAERRVIIATMDPRALARYLKAGVLPRFPSMSWGGKPTHTALNDDLTAEPIAPNAAALETLAQLDDAILEHRRAVDHEWLMRVSEGFIYRRTGQAVGYGYHGVASGPFCWLNPADAPGILGRAENAAAARLAPGISFEIPGINRAALDYCIGRGFRLDPFMAFFMSDAPVGKFENYVFPNPPFFI